jgi:hypothetical protein
MKNLKVDLHLSCLVEIEDVLKKQNVLLRKIMTKVNELESKFTLISEQLTKATAEIVAEVQALQDALVNVEIPPAAEVALQNIVDKAQILDDLNADQPTA